MDKIGGIFSGIAKAIAKHPGAAYTLGITVPSVGAMGTIAAVPTLHALDNYMRDPKNGFVRSAPVFEKAFTGDTKLTGFLDHIPLKPLPPTSPTLSDAEAKKMGYGLGERVLIGIGNLGSKIMPKDRAQAEARVEAVKPVQKIVSTITKPIHPLIRSALQVGEKDILLKDGNPMTVTLDDSINSLNTQVNNVGQTLVNTGDKLTAAIDNFSNMGREALAQTVGSTVGSVGLLSSLWAYNSAKKNRQRLADKYRLNEKRNLLNKRLSAKEFRAKATEIDALADKQEELRYRDYILPALLLAKGTGLGYLSYRALNKAYNQPTAPTVEKTGGLLNVAGRFAKSVPGLTLLGTAGAGMGGAAILNTKLKPTEARSLTGYLVDAGRQTVENSLPAESKKLLADNVLDTTTHLKNVAAVAPHLIDNADKALTGVNKSLGDVLGLTAGLSIGGAGLTAASMIYDKFKSKRKREAANEKFLQESKLDRQNLSDEDFTDKVNKIDADYKQQSKLRWSDYITPGLLSAGGIGAGILGYKKLRGNFEPS